MVGFLSHYHHHHSTPHHHRFEVHYSMLAHFRQKMKKNQHFLRTWSRLYDQALPDINHSLSGVNLGNLQQWSPNCLCSCLLIYQPSKDRRYDRPEV
jgi:hypothetical protein